MNTNDIVAKLWNLCHVLRDDGVSYQQYVTELTYLLFLKMAQERKIEDQLPPGYHWKDLESKDGIELLNFYRGLLLHLGTKGSSRVQAIYANASTTLKQPRILRALVEAMDELEWYSAAKDDFGDLYEGLLQKNAGEVKSGAGQYFTPRALIRTMVALTQPQAGEVIQDPAAGTCGFLIEADRYIKQHTDNLFDLKESVADFQRKRAYQGMELVGDTQRLGMMNLMLHDIEGELILGDTLSDSGKRLPKADLILTNPPFGTKKGGGLPSRDDFTYPTSNKQLAFLQHIYRGLKPGGRAAVVLPDNVLFEGGIGKQIRADFMEKCNLHTILRLPTGIFYSQGVKTNVLFFTRGDKEKGNTKEVWVYDLRANMPQFGKRTPLTPERFRAFEEAFGDDPHCRPESLAKRKETDETGRFRRFTRQWISERSDSLDISWLKDESEGANDEIPDPVLLAREAMMELEGAMEEVRSILEDLGEDPEEVEA